MKLLKERGRRLLDSNSTFMRHALQYISETWEALGLALSVYLCVCVCVCVSGCGCFCKSKTERRSEKTPRLFLLDVQRAMGHVCTYLGILRTILFPDEVRRPDDFSWQRDSLLQRNRANLQMIPST